MFILPESDVRDELIHSLREWGVRPGEGGRHSGFQDQILRTGVQYSRLDYGAAASFEEHVKTLKATPSLPRDRTQALRHVLLKEIDGPEDDIFYAAKDCIGMNYPPNFRVVDDDTDRSVYRYVRKKDFVKFKNIDVDPFHRFQLASYSRQDWYCKIWDNLESLSGHIFEALVAHHVVFNMPCASCKLRNSLKWNGGIHAVGSWNDIVCTNSKCLATYEIKSKRNDDAVNKGLDRNSFPGGSFRTFQCLPPNNSRYVVIVSRAYTYQSKEKKYCHRVTLAKINKVVPRLCSESFVDTRNNIRIRSEIIMDQGHKKSKVSLKWCSIPKFDPAKESDGKSMTEIARSVFDDHFGAGAWSSSKARLEESLSTIRRDSIGSVGRAFGSLRISRPPDSHTPSRYSSSTGRKDVDGEVEPLTAWDL